MNAASGESPIPEEVSKVDPMIGCIADALDQIRSEEFDYETLRAASDVMGHDMVSSWRPSLSYLPPEKNGDAYHVTVFAKGACETCPDQTIARRQHRTEGAGTCGSRQYLCA